jgi:uncharacterized OB-fold protein
VSATLPVGVPAITEDTHEFWEALRAGRFLLRRCDDCAQPIWYPRPTCPSCGSERTRWVPASGRGHVYAFTVTRRTRLPGWEQAAPYVTAYVELEEGPRVLTNVVGCDPDRLRIGTPVHIVYETGDEGQAVYRFEPDRQEPKEAEQA